MLVGNEKYKRSWRFSLWAVEALVEIDPALSRFCQRECLEIPSRDGITSIRVRKGPREGARVLAHPHLRHGSESRSVEQRRTLWRVFVLPLLRPRFLPVVHPQPLALAHSCFHIEFSSRACLHLFSTKYSCCPHTSHVFPRTFRTFSYLMCSSCCAPLPQTVTSRQDNGGMLPFCKIVHVLLRQ